MTYTGPREQAILWQQQPAGAPFDWAQVLGEILPPAIGGPLPPAQQPTALLVTHGASARLSRPEVVRLADALRVWLARTSWSAELPPAPEGVDVSDLDLPHRVTPSPLAERLAAEALGHICQCRHRRQRHTGPEYLGACAGTPDELCNCEGFVLRSGFLP